MRESLRRIHCPIATFVDLSVKHSSSLVELSSRPTGTGLRSAALALQSVTRRQPLRHIVTHPPRKRSAPRSLWHTAASECPDGSSRAGGKSEDGGLGQARSLKQATSGSRQMHYGAEATIDRSLVRTSQANHQPSVRCLGRRALTVRRIAGHEGVWDMFLELRDSNELGLLTVPHADIIRDLTLAAALTRPEWIAELFEVARSLQVNQAFEWPQFYPTILRHYLQEAEYDIAFSWHLRLYREFPPSNETFGALLASLAADPDPELQRALMSLYTFSTERAVYDILIPTLFQSGHSIATRSWRKLLIRSHDLPTTARSRPFLGFVLRYYPQVVLTQQELSVFHMSENTREVPSDSITTGDGSAGSGSKYSDSFFARWFASSWSPTEFTINFMQRLGVRIIGPRSLQSLALRESDPELLVGRITQLHKLGISVAPTVYCRALVTFVKEGKHELLNELLHCDIHPDEFEDAETRRMILAAAAREQNVRLEQLLDEVGWAAVEWAPPKQMPLHQQLNGLLKDTLSARGIGRTNRLIDHMESVDVSISQENGTAILSKAFEKLSYHPGSVQFHSGLKKDYRLERAIELTQRIARHDVAIPTQLWRILLYNLGRSGRIGELEALSHQIVELFTTGSRGLIPVHRLDLPSGSLRRPDGKEEEFEKLDEPFYIPCDLPFSHREHPVQKIFDTILQRAIVRWGFDKTLASDPAKSVYLAKRHTGAQGFDIASGVRLLASLRDQGVLIDQQVVKKAIISRTIVAQIPGRKKARSRTQSQFSADRIKELVDEAWNDELLPNAAQLAQAFEDRKATVWNGYSKLLSKAYDPDGEEEEEEEEEQDDEEEEKEKEKEKEKEDTESWGPFH